MEPERSQTRKTSFTQGTPAAGASRHIACRACRERKVRCEGGQPKCRECAKRGFDCIYPSPQSGNVAKEEVIRIIKALGTRLARAEAETSVHRGTISGTTRVPASTTSLTDSPLSTTELQSARQSLNEIIDAEESESITPTARENLHARYFSTFQSPFPMIDQKQYLEKIRVKPLTIQVISLSYAVMTLGAVGQDTLAENTCYHSCRRYLEKAEVSDTENAIMSLEGVQACILIALYEYRCTLFHRAHLSLARALRLIRLLNLEKEAQTQTNNADHIEECRRALWVAYILERFANIGTERIIILDDSEVSARLPASHWPDAVTMAHTSSLQVALTQPALPGLSGFAGVVIMAHIWGRCMDHIYLSKRATLDNASEDPKVFWERHYDVDLALIRVMTSCCGHLIIPPGEGEIPTIDPNVLFVNLAAQAVTIYLHTAATEYIGMNGLTPGANNESETRCQVAAKAIATLVNRIPLREIFTEINIFAARCLYAAARVLVRAIKRLHCDASFFELLHSLLRTMNDCKDLNPLLEMYVNQLNHFLEGDGSEPSFHPR